MAIDPSIILQGRPVNVDLTAIRQAQQQQAAAQQEQQLRGLQIQSAQGQLGDQQRQRQAEDTLNRAMAASLGPDGMPDIQKLTTGLASAGQGHLIPGVIKSHAEAQEAAVKLKESHQKVDEAESELLGRIGVGGKAILEAGGPNAAANAAGFVLQQVASYTKAGLLDKDHAAALVGNIDPEQNPQGIQQTLAVMTQPTKVGREATAAAGAQANQASELQMRAAQLPGIQADTQVKQQVAQGTVGGLTPEQQQQATDRAAQLGLAKTREAREARTAAESDVPVKLTPEGLALTAKQFAMTGQLPPMGMGKQGAAVRTQIINQAADIYKNLDLPSQVAAYKANQKSYSDLQGQLDKLTAFESTAGKNLQQFLTAAKGVVDTGSPLLNQPLRTLSQSVLGDPKMAAYAAARQVVLPEFARIISNPNLSGTLSDSSRGEIQNLLKGSATLKQAVAVAQILTQDAENRRTSMQQQIQEVQKRIATPPGSAAESTAPKSDPLGLFK